MTICVGSLYSLKRLDGLLSFFRSTSAALAPTVALYGVVRKWVSGRDINGIFRIYFSLFRECFVQSFGISIGWFLLAFFLYFDYHIMRFNGSFFILGFVTLIFLAITVYLFPAMAHFNTNWKNMIRNSLTMAIAYPLKTMLLVGILLLTILFIYLFPISILILGSVSAYLSYRVCHNLFEKMADS
ncbi:DUF624 domain-containing protein [Neobacillus sp. SuZ13]|uniref:YesL family protein n=1 Tax=Neobacillus sp. SuZ13 TaxID=3047875 RepID=UPI0024BF19F6|nr:DUF624 domain-containing protein [Neobacillus sp. SuZ13]WHY66839.1 DUF624 domain-containing protein [Neobacillus sp. SuZ13]